MTGCRTCPSPRYVPPCCSLPISSRPARPFVERPARRLARTTGRYRSRGSGRPWHLTRSGRGGGRRSSGSDSGAGGRIGMRRAEGGHGKPIRTEPAAPGAGRCGMKSGAVAALERNKAPAVRAWARLMKNPSSTAAVLNEYGPGARASGTAPIHQFSLREWGARMATCAGGPGDFKLRARGAQPDGSLGFNSNASRSDSQTSAQHRIHPASPCVDDSDPLRP